MAEVSWRQRAQPLIKSATLVILIAVVGTADTTLAALHAAHGGEWMKMEGGEHSKYHTPVRGTDEIGICAYLGFLSSMRKAEQPPPTLSFAPSQSE